MARDTISTVIDRISRQLSSSIRNELNTIGAVTNSTQTTITFTHPLANSLRSGAVVSVGTELLRVISVDRPAKTAVVIRGWQDSVASAHTVDEECIINPRFTRFDIFDAIISEVDSWSPDLFRVVDIDVDTADDDQTLELPAEYSDVVGIVSLNRNWTDDDSTAWPDIEYRLQRGTVGSWSGVSTSGLLIRLLPDMGSHVRVGKIHVALARPFDMTAVTQATALVTDVGLEWSQLELVELGVRSSLVLNDEAARSGRFVQDEPRRAEEVPVNAALGLAQVLRDRYYRRKAEEIAKLRHRYPLETW